MKFKDFLSTTALSLALAAAPYNAIAQDETSKEEGIVGKITEAVKDAVDKVSGEASADAQAETDASASSGGDAAEKPEESQEAAEDGKASTEAETQAESEAGVEEKAAGDEAAKEDAAQEQAGAKEDADTEADAAAAEKPAAEEPAADGGAQADTAEKRDAEATGQEQAAEPKAETQEQKASGSEPEATGRKRSRASSGDADAKASAEAEAEPLVVVKDDLSEAEKKQMARDEKRRRERARENRDELLGSAAVGAVVGALVPLLGGKVVEDEGDRIVVERNGRYYVRKDENELLKRDGARVRTEELAQGRTRTTVTRRNGAKVVTLRDAGGYIIKRTRVRPNGDEIVLIDNTDVPDREPADFRRELRPFELRIPRDEYIVESSHAGRRELRRALMADQVEEVERPYTLREVRESDRLREKVRRVDLDNITFNTDSYAVTRSQVPLLDDIGTVLSDIIRDDPDEIFLIEGHTDAVGADLYNLTLSDRRAETVARILTDVYDVPPENLVVQGYGEQHLKVETEDAERANRRVTVRRITPLLSASNR